MYTSNGKYINFNRKIKNKRIIEHMDNATASFNTLRLHDKCKEPVSITYMSDKVMLTKENKDKTFKTMLDVDFANDTVGIYSNATIQNNLIFYPENNEDKKEISKGIVFYNKDKKIVGAIHKDSKDKSDLVFRSGYSDESAFGLSERLRISNSENRVKISGALDADQLCLGSTCLNKTELDSLKKLLNNKPV
jgi:phage pi2 protein 07